jgi:hypothetical protein
MERVRGRGDCCECCSCSDVESFILLTSHRYVVYHSVVAIVRQCFRPESNESEFNARRSLTTALQFLRTIDVS